MIAYLTGKVLKKLEKTVILDTGNIGYLVHLPAPLFEKIEIKQDLELYIYTKVREDDISLFGFATLADMDFFKQLISVNGIGPKLGMEILSVEADKVKGAIVSSNLQLLCKIPGIGKKTAERIVIELKNKVVPEDLNRIHSQLGKEPDEDAINAIMSLGYQKYEILRILKDMPEETKTTEEMITYFLRNV